MQGKNTQEKVEAFLFDIKALTDYGKITNESMIITEQFALNKYCNINYHTVDCYCYALYLINKQYIVNEDILNIACGDGYESIIIAHMGAKVYAFDISPLQVLLSEKRALLNNLSERIDSRVMSVYELQYPDSKFSFVYGNACLHHFDIERAVREISRVMKQGGIAIFSEPFAGSLKLQKIREIVPVEKDVVSPYEKQLTNDDLKIMNKYFQEIQIKEFGLFNRLDRIFNHPKLLQKITAIDSFILDNFPFCRRFARDIVIKAIK